MIVHAARSLLRRLLGSTIARVGLAVILVEIVVLAALGEYYLGHLQRDIDHRAAERLAAPGRLMQDGLLRLASVSDREIMRGLVGQDLSLAMIVGRDLNVFYATDPQLVGHSVTEISGVDPAWFTSAEESSGAVPDPRNGGAVLVSVVPLRVPNSTTPFLYSYVALEVAALEREKSAGLRLVVLGSLLCLALTVFVLSILLAKHEAQLASRSKSAFLAMMSHELRTPINAIVGILDLLRVDLAGEKPRELIGLCQLSASNLMRLIDDVLDVARAEAGALKLEPSDFSLAEAVEEVASLLGARAGTHGLDLLTFVDPRLPALLSGDPIRVKQILYNLVGNAIKFTPKGHVAIVVRAEHEADGICSVLVEVSDSGGGIGEAQQAELFQPFVQLDPATTQRVGGVGLGLSICRHLVTLMGGAIGVRSRPGEGATFWLRLALPILAPAPASPHRLAGLRLLLAVPDLLLRGFVARYLGEDGAEIVETADSEAALRVLAELAAAGAPVDVAVIESTLACRDGLPLAAAIAGHAALQRTGLVQLDPPSVAVKSGLETSAASGRLARPFRRAALSDAVLAAVGRPAALVVPAQGPVPKPLPPTPKVPAVAAPRADGRILVVDDNPVNRIVLRNFIEHMGLRADITNDGAAAWQAYQSASYDLVLTDCHMPVMDGFELARRIRASERAGAQRVPIVALTADTLGETAVLCRKAGIDDRLCKPIRLAELAEVIAKMLPDAALPARPEETPAETAVVLDPGPLTAACGDDPVERAELIELFFSSSERLLANLRGAVAEGRFAEAEEAAHAMGGIAYTIGAYDFGNACAATERHLRGGDNPEAMVAERQLGPALERVRDAIAALSAQRIGT